MKKIITLIFILTAFAGYSQETINYIWKRQPVKFSKIAHADTIFLSGESPYGAYGSAFAIDSTTDGRYFINDNANYNDSISILTNALADSTALLRSNISDTADVVRAEFLAADQALRTVLKQNISDTATQIRSELSDSTYFDLDGGDYLRIEASANDSLFIGASSGLIREQYTTFQVAGQMVLTPSSFSAPSADYNAKNGNVVFVGGFGKLESIINCAVGTELTFFITDGAGLQIDPADFTANSQIIRTLTGGARNYDDYDIVKILCTSPNEYAIISESGDNQ